MIRVVGANPAMDRVGTWPRLAIGGVNRASDVLVVAGGKGLNVCRAVRVLGMEVAAYGFLGGTVGEYIRQRCRADGIEDRHTQIAGDTRVCFIVVEPDAGRSTVLNEPGPWVTQAEASTLLGTLAADTRPDDLLLLSGSMPEGVGAGLAGDIVAVGRSAGARTIVDCSGPALAAAVERRPWMVKCNRSEFAGLVEDEAVTARRDPQLTRLRAAMLRLLERGVAAVVVTLGAEGLLAASATGVLRVRVPRVAVMNATGSGDLLLAGLAVSLQRDPSLSAAVALGAACGVAGAMNVAPGLSPGTDLAALASQVDITRLGADP